MRKEVVEEQEREARREEVKEQAVAQAAADAKTAAAPPAETPKKVQAFENLVRMLGSNAAMVLGAYADPRSGQPMIDPEAARELIDMLDALHEKTKGNLAPEEDSLLLDLLGKLKMTYVEVNQALAAQAAQAASKAKGRERFFTTQRTVFLFASCPQTLCHPVHLLQELLQELREPHYS